MPQPSDFFNMDDLNNNTTSMENDRSSNAFLNKKTVKLGAKIDSKVFD